jgi:hypothetical protein
MASWKNRAKVADVLTRLPPAVKEALATQLEVEVAGLVAAIKRAADVDPDPGLEKTPGELGDSVHSYDGHRQLQKIVVADAKDPKGEFYGMHVEVGHLTPHGEHVPPHPYFFPTYRARKASIKHNLRRAAVDAAKRVAAAWLS